MKIKLNKIVSNPNQPRKYFDPVYIRRLADNIEENGLQQPIKVRPYEKKYQIVIGECRYRAHKLLAWDDIECIVEDMSDEKAFRISLIENIVRQNLSPIEEANGMLKISSKQREISKQLNLSENRVSQKIALLKLPKELYPFFNSFAGFSYLSEAHGRLLLSFKKFLDFAVTGDVVPNENRCSHWNDRTEAMFFEHFNDPKNDVKTYFSDYVYPSWDTKDGKHTDKPHTKIKDCILYDFTKMCYVEEWSVSQLKEKIDFYKYDIMRSTISINPYGMDEYDKLDQELNGLIKTMKDLEPELTPSENFSTIYEASILEHMDWIRLSEMDDIKEIRKNLYMRLVYRNILRETRSP